MCFLGISKPSSLCFFLANNASSVPEELVVVAPPHKRTPCASNMLRTTKALTPHTDARHMLNRIDVPRHSSSMRAHVTMALLIRMDGLNTPQILTCILHPPSPRFPQSLPQTRPATVSAQARNMRPHAHTDTAWCLHGEEHADHPKSLRHLAHGLLGSFNPGLVTCA